MFVIDWVESIVDPVAKTGTKLTYCWKSVTSIAPAVPFPAPAEVDIWVVNL